ncbi:hypothetical protein D3C80_1533850 [compost metagenome]
MHRIGERRHIGGVDLQPAIDVILGGGARLDADFLAIEVLGTGAGGVLVHREHIRGVVVDGREVEYPAALGGGCHRTYRQVPTPGPAPSGDDAVLGRDEGHLGAQATADFVGHIDIEALEGVVVTQKRLRWPVGGGGHFHDLAVVNAVQRGAGPRGACGERQGTGNGGYSKQASDWVHR